MVHGPVNHGWVGVPDLSVVVGQGVLRLLTVHRVVLSGMDLPAGGGSRNRPIKSWKAII